MPREVTIEGAVDTNMFAPTQLQTRYIANACMAGWAEWSRECLVSFPKLIREKKVGLVVVGLHIDWLEPLSFFGAEGIAVSTMLRVRGDRGIIQGDVRFEANGKAVARAEVMTRTVAVADDSLAARPVPVEGWLLDQFRDDERLPGDTPTHATRVGVQHEALGTAAERVGEGRHDFRVQRSDCEVADQWSFVEVPSILEAARETLAFGQDEARAVLSQPLASLTIELSRPMYVYDQGYVASEVFKQPDGSLCFSHAIRSDAGTGFRHAVAIERFRST